jgi:hypothetical protein
VKLTTPFSVKVKNGGAIPPLPLYVFMAWYLTKYRDNFTFSFTFRLQRGMIWCLDTGNRVTNGSGGVLGGEAPKGTDCGLFNYCVRGSVTAIRHL